MSEGIAHRSDRESNEPLHLEIWRPEKRRAFLGRSAPLGWDVVNRHQLQGRAVPNAMLENAIGLMLCYDELWFLNRHLCPADMQDLDFVRFVSDDPELSAVAEEAFTQGLAMLRAHRRKEGGFRVSEGWKQQMTQRLRRTTQLSRTITQAMSRAGHRCELSFTGPTRNGMIDVDAPQAEWFALDAVGLGPMDWIASSFFTPLSNETQKAPDDTVFEAHKVETIERVLHLRSTDALGPRGAYHDFITELRKDKRVGEFRSFLAGRPSTDGTATELAKEIDQLITAYQKEAFRRMHRPAMLRTIGSMTLGAAANQVLPGAGGVLGAMVNADRIVSDFKYRRSSRWAMFVIDARSQPNAAH